MAFLCFNINSIPDLSLSKYASLGESGVDGVLKQTSSFLRQINRKGVLSKAFFHLLYIYSPDAASGKRLKVYFVASGKDVSWPNFLDSFSERFKVVPPC
jgi:hypothetical protein